MIWLYFQNSVSFVVHTGAVGLSCKKHTSGYKLLMFPVPITVDQQCMKQPHLLHRLLLFIVTYIFACFILVCIDSV